MRKAPLKVTIDEAFGALLRQNFGLFVRFAARELLGAGSFTPEWHLDAIEHQLLRLRDGDNLQLIVTIPPRHLKSIMISSAWVAWMLGRQPQLRFVCASYALDLAEKHARDCLKIMEASWYRKVFPNMRLTKRSVMDFETYAGGGRFSTSTTGGLTGRGGEWAIVDDPHKADEAFSEVMRQATYDWYFNTMRGRANTDQTRFIIVMQRLHEDDLAGRLLRHDSWEELRLPSIATLDEKIPLTRGRFHHRREGHVLTPNRQSLAYLRARQAEQPYVFAAQNQQDPVSRIGAFVMPEWFGTYDTAPRTGITILSCDTASKTTVRSDWSVAIASRFYEGRFYVLDVFRKRVEFGDLMSAVRSMCTQYNVDRLLIEDAASGQQLIQQLRHDMSPADPYPIAVTPVGDKVQRFEAIASRIQAGQVVLPQAGPWVADFIAEVTRFPGGRHDDQADALAQMLANPPPTFFTPTNAGPELIVDRDDGQRLSYDDEGEDPWGPRSWVG